MKGAKGHHHSHGHKAKHAHMEVHMKKRGGGASRENMWVSGNPDVEKEAEGKEPYAKGDESDGGHKQKKHGGRAKHHRKDGGKVLGLMTGGNVRPRLDRPGRKRGGGVGSDRSPLSSAHRTSGAESHPKSEDSYGGTPK